MKAHLGIRLGALMLVGIVLLGLGVRDLTVESKKAIDLYEISDWSDIEENDHISGDVEFNIGAAVLNKNDNKVTSKIYCLVDISGYDEGATMDQFVGVVVSKSADISKMDEIYNDSYDWWQGNGGSLPEGSDRYTFDGKVRKMTKTEQTYFEQYIRECNQDPSKLAPYVIVPFSGGTKVLIGIGLAFILIPGIVFAVTISKNAKNRSRDKELYEEL